LFIASAGAIVLTLLVLWNVADMREHRRMHRSALLLICWGVMMTSLWIFIPEIRDSAEQELLLVSSQMSVFIVTMAMLLYINLSDVARRLRTRDLPPIFILSALGCFAVLVFAREHFSVYEYFRYGAGRHWLR
jgi:hypothetical protein